MIDTYDSGCRATISKIIDLYENLDSRAKIKNRKTLLWLKAVQEQIENIMGGKQMELWETPKGEYFYRSTNET